MQPQCLIQQEHGPGTQSDPETAERGSTLPLFSLLTCANPELLQIRETNLRIAAKITTRRNISEWSALEKPVAPLKY
jgi:hypothetical protein